MTTNRLSLLIITTTAILCWTAVVQAHSSQSPRSGFDEPCNKTLKCKSQSWLTCDTETGKCKCAKSDEMMYDPLRGKCVAMIGERCKFGFDEESGSAAWYEKAECVLGSICGPSGICSCPQGTYEDEELNQCSLVKEHSWSCLKNSECNQDKFLNCIQGRCQCDPDNTIYNDSPFTSYTPNYRYSPNGETVPRGICIGRVGTRCSQNTSPKKFCVHNSYCQGTCQCVDTYGETSERLCGLGYQQSCSDTNICSDKLRCTGSHQTDLRQEVKCQCSDPDVQIHDGKTCRGLVGAPCDPTDVSSCIEKASCIERDNTFQCECDDGFIDTESGRCQLTFGSSCNYRDSVHGVVTGVCDDIANLRCKRGKCSCKNEGDFYENEKRKCLRTVGLRCNATSECVSNSECIRSNGNFWGRCSCLDGFSVTKQHVCALPSGLDVSSEDDIFAVIETEETDEKNSTLIIV